MPVYQYRCRSCQRLFHLDVPADRAQCPDCRNTSVRIFDFQARASLAEHFNMAAGQYVNNQREFRDALKRRSDEVSERLGIEHDFQPLTAAEVRDHDAHAIPLDTISPIIAKDAGL